MNKTSTTPKTSCRWQWLLVVCCGCIGMVLLLACMAISNPTMTSIGLTLLLGSLVVGGFIARNEERIKWNNGICQISGKPWVLFDTDSQGGRMYKDNEGNFCDISYNVDNYHGC